MPALDAILRELYAEPGWATLALVLRVGFMIALARILFLLLFARRSGPSGEGLGIGFAVLVLLPFLAVLGHQASWQLAGRMRPDFLRFMQQYDRRQFNPARAIQRGKILDRQGKILAFTYVDGRQQPRRQYPHREAACHLTGYMHPIYGLSGIEAAAHTRLTGGQLAKPEDWKELGRQMLAGQAEIRGEDVRLSVDIELQRAAWRALRDRRGTVIALDPRNGQILALVSAPGFDPESITPALFAPDAGEARLLNRATHGLYPPGSTFKILGAAAAVRAGAVEHLLCAGQGFTTHAHYPRIRDHEYYERGGWGGHGRIGMEEALAASCNEFFAQLNVRLGLPALQATAAGFRFAESAILFQGSDGALRLPAGPGIDLREGDRYGLAQVGIGQGNLVCSPAHLLVLAAGVANQGRVWRPTLDPEAAPQAWGQPLTAGQAAKVAAAMRRVVTHGTGKGLRDLPFAVAGKTGTAQNPRGAAHAWFVGFAPYAQPRVAVVALLENAGYGSAHALPVAREVLVKAGELGYLESR
jgi:peptidoglycan glycosyltransferase